MLCFQREGSRGSDYDRFGTVALFLQLLPPFSMLFLMTSAAGSALWASAVENRRALLEQEQGQSGSPPNAHYVDEEATY